MVGTVWAPGNAPGMVPTGQEIPVSGAMVYLGLEKPDPIAQIAQCTPCVEAPPSAQITDSKGKFTLHPGPGTYWLIVQKAQFRLETQIVVSDGNQMLPPELTTLPSVHDPDNGKWIPRIALATGYSGDPMESILGKLGIGQVNGSGTFVSTSAAGKFDLYTNSRSINASDPNVSELVTNLDKMMEYHIIFFPCSVSGEEELLQDEAVRKNIRDYVAAGGRLYVADWAGEWVDNIFPQEIELAGDGEDTPAEAYDRATDTWDTALFGASDGSPSYESQAQVTDEGMSAWLDGQMGAQGNISAGGFSVTGNWNRINKLEDVQLGVDTEGAPVIDSPKTYVAGTSSWDGDVKPLMATYEPGGCGRVMYSTFHTTSTAHVGLLPQERVLVYLLLEIGVCKDDPIVD